MPEPLRLFVYGTLKRGFAACERYLSGTTVTEAVVSGDIYALDAGHPAIVVPNDGIVAVGTADFSADLTRQSEEDPADIVAPDGAVIHGEIAEITDALTLRALDDYEGFDPSRPDDGLYRRVLVPVRRSDHVAVLVWTYAMASAEGTHLPGGEWTGP